MLEDQPRVTLVVAFNYLRFLEWCRATGHVPSDRSLRYVGSANSARGYHDVDIVYVSPWWQRRDASDIEEALGPITQATVTHWSDPRDVHYRG